jgi:hypothetical protein
MRAVIGLAVLAVLSGCTTETPAPAAPAPVAAATPAEPTRAANGQIQLPAGMDTSRLTTAAPEPSGPGTPLGPHAPITVAAAAGLPTHTIYYPTYPSGFSGAAKLPVLIWGNGACRNEGRRFEGTLTKVASHGFLVVAVGLFEPKEGAPSTTGAQMIEGQHRQRPPQGQDRHRPHRRHGPVLRRPDDHRGGP